MKTGNIIQEKSFAFAVRIVNAFRYLYYEKNERVLSKQLLRSGTSIGANIEESIGGHSKADFINKITIAYKEARETFYWIRLLGETEYLSAEQAASLLHDVDELCRIIGQIQRTLKYNQSRKSISFEK
jgi:four helix bundle protein